MYIPSKLHNSLTEKPFSHCNICENSLHETEYLIEKAYKRFDNDLGEELLFEVAICLPCIYTMRGQLSTESLLRIEDLFKEKEMAMQQQPELLEKARQQPLHYCLLSGKSVDHCKSYQVYARCSGDEISQQQLYILGDSILSEIQESLSKSTKEELERFTDEHVGGPPELKKLLNSGEVILF